ncbi:proprotein convertase P-domain-containing protein [Algoriphagus jejuensis]|uniref:proprotein convertase P-domain-containing protein n=1 Tax=Algoriphagus jejuensis TaxID=419934 RepID=UPI0031DCCC77
MANTENSLYTYRNGKKVYLVKEPDRFVVRATPEAVENRGFNASSELVSPHSTRVRVSRESLTPIMEEMRNEAVTHHAYKQEINDEEFLITDRILITFKQPVSNEVLGDFISKYALLLLSQYSEREFLLQLTNQTGMNPLKLVVLINETENDLVENCEHDLNQRMTTSAITIPTDARYNQQWHLHSRFIDSAFDTRSSANCESAWQLLDHFGASEVVIAVSDDGCKIDHSDFDSTNKFAQWAYMQGSNLIDRDSISANPQHMYQFGADHGTRCCGVVAAEVDGLLTVGAAPGCRLLPIKWESSGAGLYVSDSKMMTVLAFISDKADVMSNSWGSSPQSNFATNVVNRISQLAQTGGRRGKGIVFLWAAGNENCPIEFSGNIDIPFDRGRDSAGNWRGVKTSRDFQHNLVGIPGVMYVAALASNAQRSHYSNYGEGISICAPSNNIHLYRRGVVSGLGITTTSGDGQFFSAQFGGTSSSTPLVAGITGLVISANPELSAQEVISILQKTASKDLNLAAYPKSTPAAFDPNPSWDISPVAPFTAGDFTNIGHEDGTWSGWFGFGKVDARSAVAEALRTIRPPDPDNGIVTKSSTPSLSIPDNNTVGITDTITIDNNGTVSNVTVDLDLTHTFIGDLVIKLISPRGTPAILHERNGGSAKNILKSFDLQNAPTLSRFNGEPASGRWTLEVVDAAAVDIGKLNKWTINIGVGNVKDIELEDSPGMSIPDNNTIGIERSLNITGNGTIKDIKIGLDITHSYIADLVVNLVSPEGSVIGIHNRSGGSDDNIIRDYEIATFPALRSLQGQTANGLWKLQVADVVGHDVGKLNKWSIKITMI